MLTESLIIYTFLCEKKHCHTSLYVAIGPQKEKKKMALDDYILISIENEGSRLILKF
jgi:hypothetical protein